MTFTGAPGEVNIITLDPGHFHAALIQKEMLDQLSPDVHVFAPEGPDVKDHLDQIDGFNSRSDNPTHWRTRSYTADDFLEKLLETKPGNVVVLAGNNRRKTQYIKACVDAGLNVLADKPMCINTEGFRLLQEAFACASKNNVLLYDIMTERSEITTILQKEFVQTPQVFGRLIQGSPDAPAVVKESVHHFFKTVAGNPVKRPPWYFDTTQQGEGIVDVTSHLVDLVMWECFEDQKIDYTTDVRLLSAKRRPTLITKAQFEKATRLDDFPPYLKDQLDHKAVLPCYSNGEMVYTLKGVHVKVSVIWNFQAPPGTQDTHFSVIRGTRTNIIIRQAKEQNYRPELYVEPTDPADTQLTSALQDAFADLQKKYPGISLSKEEQRWHVQIPDTYRIGHEAHFRQVTERYLQYLVDGQLADWEVPNMISKYYTTTQALDMADEPGDPATLPKDTQPFRRF